MYRRSILLFSFALFLGACESKTEEEPLCNDGFIRCDGVCIDFTSNPAHCGACGQACDEGQACGAGRCTARCTDGLSWCDDTCVDLQRDRAHCGACNQDCGEADCEGGVCASDCEQGESLCAGTCVDTKSDPAHCGACGGACDNGLICAKGKCACPEGMEACDGACVDTKADASHCGSCDAACEDGESCVQGACACPAGTESCGGACVDTRVDSLHCGDCDTPCGPGAGAIDGICALAQCTLHCEEGRMDCNQNPKDGCEVQVESDAENCGLCGLVCGELPNIASSDGCDDGDCKFTCLDEFDDCDGDPRNGCEVQLGSTAHCAACFHDCDKLKNTAATACDDGTCAIVACADGYASCDDDMQNGCEIHTDEDADNCGDCGERCDLSCRKGKCTDFAQIAAGGGHVCVLLDSGDVWCWGLNNFGQLGRGSINDSHVPAMVPDLGAVKRIASGNAHTCALSEQGEVSCWGFNGGGQLGDRSTSMRSKPVPMVGGLDVKDIATGSGFTCLLHLDGSVSCVGKNDWGQLGNPIVEDDESLDLVTVAGLPPLDAIVAGTLHACGMSAQGEVWCWGYNLGKELGGGSAEPKSATPVKVGGLSGARQLSAGAHHTCALTSTDELWCWGSNQAGQLGGWDGSPQKVQGLPKMTQIATGEAHTCGLTEAKELWCWGYNSSGQLGNGTDDRLRDPVKAIVVSDVAEVRAGGNNTYARGAGGAFWSWGDNHGGQLGRKAGERSVTPLPLVFRREP